MRFCPTVRIASIVTAVCLAAAAALRAEYVTMVDSGPSSNRVDLVFLGDGYTEWQLDTTYVSHVQGMLDHLFVEDEDPFPRYGGFFNVHRVNVVSHESGADVPPEDVFRDTALDASYYYDGLTPRLLYVDGAKADAALDDGLAGAGFSAEMRLVTVNDAPFGGGGGSFAVYAGGSAEAPEIALHELGHSFAQLADEYAGRSQPYPGLEPAAVNVTLSADGQKWAPWLGYSDPDHPEMGPIGAYQGAYNYGYGTFRPSQDSKMRSLGRPFDAVAREKIVLELYQYVDPLDGWLPNHAALVDPDLLWVDVVDPEVIAVEWLVDGTFIDRAAGELFDPAALGPGSYSITAHAYDDTPWVRIDTDLLDQSVTWSVTVTPEPGTLAMIAAALAVLCLAVVRRRLNRTAPY